MILKVSLSVVAKQVRNFKMKITKRQLRRIIKEEKAKLLKEVHGGGWNGSYGGSSMEGSEAMMTIADELKAIGATLPQEAWDRIAMGIQYVEKAAAAEASGDGFYR